MRRQSKRVLHSLGLLAGAGVLLVAGRASANGFEIPENGTEVMGRAGAWTARADNPLAVGLNPAGLAGQPTAFVVNTNLTYQKQCFSRAGNYAAGGNYGGSKFPTGDYEGKPFPTVCKQNGIGDVGIVPQLAFNYAVSSKVSIGFAPLWTPSGTGKALWPDGVDRPLTTSDGTPAPPPQRFMLLAKNARIIMPTLGVGAEVLPGLRLGASFQAVMTFFESQVSSQGSQSALQDAAQGPTPAVRSTVKWNQLFTPAFVLGALASPSPEFDIGFMFRWSADIVKKGGEVTLNGPFYGDQGSPATRAVDTTVKFEEFRLPQPWEIRMGVRYHKLRAGVVPPAQGRRDFLKHDVFDVEVDFQYSHNSSFQQITVLFPTDPQCVGLGVNPRDGTALTKCASYVPPDASILKKWQDTLAIRVGGEYVAIPDKLGLRLGGFFQTRGQDPQYLNLDFHPGRMLGFFLGATLRAASFADVSIGYGHIFVETFDNTATGGSLRGLAGTRPDNPDPSDPSRPTVDNYRNACPGQSVPSYRTCTIVNTGKLETGYNMFSIGATFRL